MERAKVADLLRSMARSFISSIHPDRWTGHPQAIQCNGEMLKEWIPISDQLACGWLQGKGGFTEQSGRVLRFQCKSTIESFEFPFSVCKDENKSLLPRATYAALHLYSRAGLVIDHNLLGWLQEQLHQHDHGSVEFKKLFAAQPNNMFDNIVSLQCPPFVFFATSLTVEQKRMALKTLAILDLSSWDPARPLIIWNGPEHYGTDAIRLPYSFNPMQIKL